MPDTPSKRRKRRKRPIRRTLIGVVLAAAVAVGMLLRGCFGLGSGDGSGDDRGDQPAETTEIQALAEVTPDAAPPPLTHCKLRLSSKGLTLNGDPIDIPGALNACRDAEEVRLRVTGGARSGTYDEIRSAFERAKIELLIKDAPDD